MTPWQVTATPVSPHKHASDVGITARTGAEPPEMHRPRSGATALGGCAQRSEGSAQHPFSRNAQGNPGYLQSCDLWFPAGIVWLACFLPLARSLVSYRQPVG